MPFEKNNIRQHIIPVIFLILATLLAYSNTLKNGFIWDDNNLIVNNLQIKRLKHIPDFFSNKNNGDHPHEELSGQYRPVRAVTFAMDYFFWKLNPAGYHFSNLFFHAVNVIFIYFLLLNLTKAGTHYKPGIKQTYMFIYLGIPFLTALFFSVHPIHTESVSWIKNRSDILALLFFLLSLSAFIRLLFLNKVIHRTLLLILSLILFIAAILSKETALTLPLILFFYIIIFLPNAEFKKAFVLTLPYWLITVFNLVFQSQVLTTQVVEKTNDTGFYTGLLIVLESMWHYFTMLAFPVNLNAERLFQIPHSLFETEIISSIVLFMIIALFFIKTFKQYPLLFFAVIWILITLLPASNIIFLNSRPIAEQRLYIPSMGFCLLLAASINILSFTQSKSQIHKYTYVPLVLAAVSVCLFLFYSTTTFIRNYDWKDDITFWSKTVESSPDSIRAHNNLGITLDKNGRTEEALSHFKKAMQMAPDNPKIYNNIGNALAKQTKIKDAIANFSKALQIDPKFFSAHTNLGNSYLMMGKTDDAIHHFSKAIALKPDDSTSHNNLGATLIRAGRIDEALKHYYIALELNPDSAEIHNNIGIAMEDKGRLEESIKHYTLALTLNPLHAKIYGNLGTVLMKKGDINKAIISYSKALSIQPGNIRVLFDLARAYSANKEFKKAISTYTTIINFQPDISSVYYNIACAYALQDNKEDAVTWLEKAISRGYDKWDLIKKDSDLESIRNTSFYKTLLKNR